MKSIFVALAILLAINFAECNNLRHSKGSMDHDMCVKERVILSQVVYQEHIHGLECFLFKVAVEAFNKICSAQFGLESLPEVTCKKEFDLTLNGDDEKGVQEFLCGIAKTYVENTCQTAVGFLNCAKCKALAFGYNKFCASKTGEVAGTCAQY